MTSYSSGKIAAAFAAKVIDLQEAMFILYSRGVLLDALPKKSTLQGNMMAVDVEREIVKGYISEVAPHEFVIACVNNLSSVIVSEDLAAINELGKILSNAKVFARKLKIKIAYHSSHMKPLKLDYLQALETGLNKREIEGVIYSSSVTEDVIPAGHTLPPEHWTQNMIQPVLFSD